MCHRRGLVPGSLFPGDGFGGDDRDDGSDGQGPGNPLDGFEFVDGMTGLFVDSVEKGQVVLKGSGDVKLPLDGQPYAFGKNSREVARDKGREDQWSTFNHKVWLHPDLH